MKSLQQIIDQYDPNSEYPMYYHEQNVERIAEEFAAEVLRWVLTETSYEKQEDNGKQWWGGCGQDLSSAELVEQYLKLPIITQK